MSIALVIKFGAPMLYWLVDGLQSYMVIAMYYVALVCIVALAIVVFEKVRLQEYCNLLGFEMEMY